LAIQTLSLTALATGLVLALSPAAVANNAMPIAQQNALVRKYCAVCHTDASKNGGLSLQHFDAAHPDPGVAAMMLGKLKTGALGAAGVKIPDKATIKAWIQATSAEAVGAHRWNVTRAAALLTASIVRDVPSPVSKDVPDSYRLIVSCRPDTHQASIDLTWSPSSPKQGQVLSALVDGKSLGTYAVSGTEKMGNGAKGSSGPGSIEIYPSKQKAALALPARTLTIHDPLPKETVVFPFSQLPPADRQALSACFSKPASHLFIAQQSSVAPAHSPTR